MKTVFKNDYFEVLEDEFTYYIRPFKKEIKAIFKERIGENSMSFTELIIDKEFKEQLVTNCGDCKHYHLEFDADGFNEEWCKINNVYLHDSDCPNFEKEDLDYGR